MIDGIGHAVRIQPSGKSSLLASEPSATPLSSNVPCAFAPGVDVRGFCAHIMADNRPFFTDYHLKMGDEQVCLGINVKMFLGSFVLLGTSQSKCCIRMGGICISAYLDGYIWVMCALALGQRPMAERCACGEAGAAVALAVPPQHGARQGAAVRHQAQGGAPSPLLFMICAP